MSSLLPHNDSRAFALVEQLRQLGPEGARRVIRAMWAKLPPVERAALTANWLFWARSKQVPPSTAWHTWGFLTGRGFGKTWAISSFINSEVEAGRAPLICLVAQDEQSAIDLQVLGPNGLIATSPPWFKARWEASAFQVVWPNGSRAYVRTPESPGKIRGLEYFLAWMSEIQSWPKATMEEAFENVFISTRLGPWRVCWDATPKPRHPLLKKLLADHELDPFTNPVVRGLTLENRANLGEGYVEQLEKRYGNTQRGRMELRGEMPEDAEGALIKQLWIDEARRHMPSRLLRRIVSIDPAVSSRKGSDTTGIVELGIGVDEQVYVLGNATGKYEASKRTAIALDWYVNHGCDLLVVETNKGGDLVNETLRLLGKERGLEVVPVKKEDKPQRQPGKVFVKEVYAKGAKEERAEPVATAYERRRVSHVIGVDLTSLEDTLTTWEPVPNADSPGDLDALVHGVVELLELSSNAPDVKTGFVGIVDASKKLYAPPKAPTSLSRVFSEVRTGRI